MPSPADPAALAFAAAAQELWKSQLYEAMKSPSPELKKMIVDVIKEEQCAQLSEQLPAAISAGLSQPLAKITEILQETLAVTKDSNEKHDRRLQRLEDLVTSLIGRQDSAEQISPPIDVTNEQQEERSQLGAEAQVTAEEDAGLASTPVSNIQPQPALTVPDLPSSAPSTESPPSSNNTASGDAQLPRNEDSRIAQNDDTPSKSSLDDTPKEEDHIAGNSFSTSTSASTPAINDSQEAQSPQPEPELQVKSTTNSSASISGKESTKAGTDASPSSPPQLNSTLVTYEIKNLPIRLKSSEPSSPQRDLSKSDTEISEDNTDSDDRSSESASVPDHSSLERVPEAVESNADSPNAASPPQQSVPTENQAAGSNESQEDLDSSSSTDPVVTKEDAPTELPKNPQESGSSERGALVDDNSDVAVEAADGATESTSTSVLSSPVGGTVDNSNEDSAAGTEPAATETESPVDNPVDTRNDNATAGVAVESQETTTSVNTTEVNSDEELHTEPSPDGTASTSQVEVVERGTEETVPAATTSNDQGPVDSINDAPPNGLEGASVETSSESMEQNVPSQNPPEDTDEDMSANVEQESAQVQGLSGSTPMEIDEEMHTSVVRDTPEVETSTRNNPTSLGEEGTAQVEQGADEMDICIPHDPASSASTLPTGFQQEAADTAMGGVDDSSLGNAEGDVDMEVENSNAEIGGQDPFNHSTMSAVSEDAQMDGIDSIIRNPSPDEDEPMDVEAGSNGVPTGDINSVGGQQDTDVSVDTPMEDTPPSAIQPSPVSSRQSGELGQPNIRKPNIRKNMLPILHGPWAIMLNGPLNTQDAVTQFVVYMKGMYEELGEKEHDFEKNFSKIFKQVSEVTIEKGGLEDFLDIPTRARTLAAQEILMWLYLAHDVWELQRGRLVQHVASLRRTTPGLQIKLDPLLVDGDFQKAARLLEAKLHQDTEDADDLVASDAVVYTRFLNKLRWRFYLEPVEVLKEMAKAIKGREGLIMMNEKKPDMWPGSCPEQEGYCSQSLLDEKKSSSDNWHDDRKEEQLNAKKQRVICGKSIREHTFAPMPAFIMRAAQETIRAAQLVMMKTARLEHQALLRRNDIACRSQVRMVLSEACIRSIIGDA